MRIAIVASTVAVIALAGCSGATDPIVTTPAPIPSVTEASPTPTEHTPLEPGNVYVDVINSQGEGDFVGAIQDVAAQTCEPGNGTWASSGTVTNSTGDKVDYRVWAAFLDAEGGTVGLVQANVDGVEASASGDFLASMPYAGGDTLTCVLRVERRAAA